MLLTNQQLDKLAASYADFKARGMLTASLNSFHVYFSLQFKSSADRVFGISIDERTDVAPPAPAPSKDDDDDEVAVVGPKIQAHVNLAKMITHMYLFLIYPISVK